MNVEKIKCGYFDHWWWKPTCWLKNVKMLYRTIRDLYQRSRYGVARMDCWDFDYYLISVLRNGLIMYHKDNNGYPGRDEFDTFEKWQNKIEDIIKLCDILLVDSSDSPKANELWEMGDLYKKEWFEEVKLYEDKKSLARKELCNFLEKWGSNLWW